MKTILFVMLPTPSHYMTSFPIAHYFKEKGFNIVFTGDQDFFENLVKENGFNYE